MEDPGIPRRTGRDPLVGPHEALLLEHANQEGKQTGSEEPLSGFARYYELGPAGEVVSSYEEAGFACEDCAYSWAYRVLGSRLWKFCLTSKFDLFSGEEDHEFSLEIEEDELQPTKAPPELRP